MLTGEPVRPTPLHFVPLSEEVPRPVIDMLIDGFVCGRESAIGEVGRPPAQDAVQSCPYLIPGPLVARHKQLADLQLDPLHTLLGRARPQILAPSVGQVPWSQGVAREVEAFAPGILHRGFRLVERQPEFRRAMREFG